MTTSSRTDISIKFVSIIITSLNISDCSHVDDDSLKKFPNLIHLAIGSDDIGMGTSIITDKGLLHVPRLRSLDVNGNEHVTAAGILTLTCLQILRSYRIWDYYGFGRRGTLYYTELTYKILLWIVFAH
ncbi:MAG: hypothetical protein Hyperionvirus3_27 [Hyperionvirus sp.]|uniref:Leucine-rich repeat protein n=1 Tax=Hyperionvirus sp. TaxID=2487770 RepID=A0A3G5A9L7_9VIRU|nr:MAG: hypothetical protein Hyperionvirus3_27 [Hyperionvirus sp.]